MPTEVGGVRSHKRQLSRIEQPEVVAGNQTRYERSKLLSYLSLQPPCMVSWRQALSLVWTLSRTPGWGWGAASPREPPCLFFLRARIEVTHHYSFGSGDPNEVSICAGLNQNGPQRLSICLLGPQWVALFEKIRRHIVVGDGGLSQGGGGL